MMANLVFETDKARAQDEFTAPRLDRTPALDFGAVEFFRAQSETQTCSELK